MTEMTSNKFRLGNGEMSPLVMGKDSGSSSLIEAA